MAELKPCPFCGSDDVGCWTTSAILPNGKHPHFVRCDNCWATSNSCCSTEEAIEAWNRRAESEELKFTRQFIHEHGLDFALASAWEKEKKDGK